MAQEMNVAQRRETHDDRTASEKANVIFIRINRVIFLFNFGLCEITSVMFAPWYRMSCMAWILKLSSTFVNGVYSKWTTAMKNTRTPMWIEMQLIGCSWLENNLLWTLIVLVDAVHQSFHANLFHSNYFDVLGRLNN